MNAGDSDSHGGRWRRSLLEYLLAFAVLGGLFLFAFSTLDYHWNWSSVWAYRIKLIKGWGVTVGLSVVCLLMSTVLAMAAVALRLSRVGVFQKISTLYVEIIRSTPLYVQILVFYYVVAESLGLQNKYVAGVMILSLFSGAYLAEVFRAGLEAIGETQRETARSLGFTTAQMYRHVIIPQAVRQVLPPTAGQFVSIIKDSSLLSIIGLSELTLNAREVNSFTYSPLESYLPLALGYLILTLPLSLWIRSWERRMVFKT